MRSISRASDHMFIKTYKQNVSVQKLKKKLQRKNQP